jgi:hypothetical protein
MHRNLRRLDVPSYINAFFIIIVPLLLSAGCGFVYPPPAIPDAVQKEVFHVGEPIALLSFDPGRTSGRIIGELHGWPFPHLEASEGIPTGTFTYVGKFNVISKSDEDGMPAGAQGMRTDYFHETPPQLSFAEPRIYATGQQAAIDALSLSFLFKENHLAVSVRMISQQKSAQAFTFKGKLIEPPKERDTSDELEGDYSADYEGYLLHSLNE